MATIVTYPGDNVTNQFAVPFAYSDTTEVVVTRANGAVTYFFVNPSLIQITSPVALATGDALTIQRVTDIDTPAVVFKNGSGTTGGQLNSMVTQLLRAAQEAKDLVLGTIKLVANVWDGQSKRIGNIANPVNAQDVVTKAFGDANYGGASATAAAASAAAANASAIAADASADAALISEQNAAASAASIVPANFMTKAANLSDVANATTARTNLSVYSIAQVDSALAGKANTTHDLTAHTQNIPFMYRNRLINGDFRVFQRASGSYNDDTYIADRWYMLTQTAAAQYVVNLDGENGAPWFLRLTQSQATAQRIGTAQIIESINCRDLRGSQVTLSGRLRCSAATTIRYAILEWTGTADVVTSDVVSNWASTTYTPGNFFIATTTAVLASGSVALSANTWTSITALTGTVGNSMNNLIVVFWTDSAQAQNVTVDFSRIQLESGAVATPFERRAINEELQLCYRYFWNNRNDWHHTLFSCVNATFAHNFNIPWPVEMRANPVLSRTTQASAAVGTITEILVGRSGCWIQVSGGSSTNVFYYFTMTVDAEL